MLRCAALAPSPRGRELRELSSERRACRAPSVRAACTSARVSRTRRDFGFTAAPRLSSARRDPQVSRGLAPSEAHTAGSTGGLDSDTASGGWPPAGARQRPVRPGEPCRGARCQPRHLGRCPQWAPATQSRNADASSPSRKTAGSHVRRLRALRGPRPSQAEQPLFRGAQPPALAFERFPRPPIASLTGVKGRGTACPARRRAPRPDYA